MLKLSKVVKVSGFHGGCCSNNGCILGFYTVAWGQCFDVSAECAALLVRVTELKWMWTTSVTLNLVASRLSKRVGNLVTHKEWQFFCKGLTNVTVSIMVQWPTLLLYWVRVWSQDVGQSHLVCTLCRSSIMWMWTPVDSCGHLWALVGTCGQLWAPVGTCGHLWTVVGTCEHLWAPVSTCGHLWALVGTCGQLWAPVDTCGHLWTVVGTCGQLWAPVGTCGHLWALVDTCGQLWTVVDTCGQLWTTLRQSLGH